MVHHIFIELKPETPLKYDGLSVFDEHLIISLLIPDGRTLLVLVVATLSLPYRQSYLGLLLLFFQWKLKCGSVSTRHSLKNDFELFGCLFFLILRRREHHIMIEAAYHRALSIIVEAWLRVKLEWCRV